MEKLLDKLRMSEWATTAAVLLSVIWWIAPQQLPIIVYKLALVTTFAFLGYWIDRRLFPEARIHELANKVWAMGMIRRAIIVAAVVIAGALAL